jgi:hypothetical protein
MFTYAFMISTRDPGRYELEIELAADDINGKASLRVIVEEVPLRTATKCVAHKGCIIQPKGSDQPRTSKPEGAIMQDDDNLKILSERITELSNKSTLILLFLSFAMVSAATLQNVPGLHDMAQPLNKALYWWKIALIPTLLGVPPVKELVWRNETWYGIIHQIKVLLLWAAAILIFVGIGYFIAAS